MSAEWRNASDKAVACPMASAGAGLATPAVSAVRMPELPTTYAEAANPLATVPAATQRNTGKRRHMLIANLPFCTK